MSPKEKTKLKFMGLATTHGPQKYRTPASIAVEEGAQMHFLPTTDTELKKLANDITEYLRGKRVNHVS